MNWQMIDELIDNLDSLRSNRDATPVELRKLSRLLGMVEADVSAEYLRKAVVEPELPRLIQR